MTFTHYTDDDKHTDVPVGPFTLRILAREDIPNPVYLLDKNGHEVAILTREEAVVLGAALTGENAPFPITIRPRRVEANGTPTGVLLQTWSTGDQVITSTDMNIDEALKLTGDLVNATSYAARQQATA